MVTPPGTKTSSTGTGEQTTDHTIGEGLYELYSASIKHDTLSEAIPGRISYIYTAGDGTEIEVVLASGYISKYLPLVIPKSVILTGPGKLRSTCLHGSSMAHDFNIEYRRFEAYAEMGFVK